MTDLWNALESLMRSQGADDEAIAAEAEKRATNPALYDCAVAVWELDQPEVLDEVLAGGHIEVDGPTPRSGKTLLYLAIVKKRIRSVALLLKHGADAKRQHAERDYLYWASFTDTEPAIMEALLVACDAVGVVPTAETIAVARRRGRTALVELQERWLRGERALQYASATDRREGAPWEVGDAVKVRSGQWANFRGVLEGRIAGTTKWRVMLSVFGRAVAAELDHEALERS